MRVGSAEVGGLIEVVEFDRRARPRLALGHRHRPARTLAAAAGERGATRVELRIQFGVAGGGILGWLSEQLAAPIVRGNVSARWRSSSGRSSTSRCAPRPPAGARAA